MMHESWGSKSFLTSKAMLFSYYICALLSFFTVFTALIAAVGAIITRYIAHKEMATQVEQHCTWIFRSIWISGVLAVLFFGIGLFAIGESNIVIPDTSFIQNFDALWGNEQLRLGLQYVLVMLAFLFLLFCWFVCRMFYGLWALINARPLSMRRA